MSRKSQIESLLFVSSKPLKSSEIAKLLEIKSKEVEDVCQELIKDLENTGRGIRIMKIADKFQMASSPDNTELIKNFLKEEVGGDLSRPALEALTIIAYRGPISKIMLDQIRGVNCSLIIRNLLMRGLIEAEYDKTKDDHYYSISFEFLKYLGLSSVEELPSYEQLSQDEKIDEVLKM